MSARYAPQARRHLEAISEYLSERSPEASRRLAGRIQETIQLLETFPHAGRPGALEGTREMKVRGFPYIIVYRVEPDEKQIVIIGVFHGAQRRPGQ